jgi:hypothetical protein
MEEGWNPAGVGIMGLEVLTGTCGVRAPCERHVTEGDEGQADRWARVYLKLNLTPNLTQL